MNKQLFTAASMIGRQENISARWPQVRDRPKDNGSLVRKSKNGSEKLPELGCWSGKSVSQKIPKRTKPVRGENR